jgi:site-specific recombinase XerD
VLQYFNYFTADCILPVFSHLKIFRCLCTEFVQDLIWKMLTLYRRHAPDCKFAAKGQNFTNCNCPVWLYGEDAAGHNVRRSLKTRDWRIAMRRLDDSPVPPEEIESRTVSDAVARYLSDCRERRLATNTIANYRYLLNLLASRFAKLPISAVTLEHLRDFRTGRVVSPRTAARDITTLRIFFNWARRQGFIEQTPAAGLRLPQIKDVATLPFDRVEIEKLLEHTIDIEQRALLLVLLYTGLRMGDAVGLSRAAVNLKSRYVTLRTMKTGAHVRVQLPASAIAALDRLPRGGRFYFWDGVGSLKNRAEWFRKRIKALGVRAGVPNVHPHRFRDTFASELLLGGADIRTVQMLLGHESVRTTERYYGNFVTSHQSLLDAATAALSFEREAPRVLAVNQRGH